MALVSLSNVLAGQPFMEVFQGVEFAALRIWQSGSYLHADEDGRSVYRGGIRGGVSRHNAVWAVEPPLVAGAPLPQYVLLRGAYGRYLGSPDAHGALGALEAAQRERDGEEVDAIMWEAIACSGHDVVGGPDARGVVLLRDRSGRYLRGNKSLLPSRRSVSAVHGYVENEDTLRWEVVDVPRNPVKPELPMPTEADMAELFSSVGSSPPLQREILYATADDAGNIGEGQEVWASFQYRGWSVQLLREKIARHVGYDDFTMCVRAGRHGQHSPLIINLPRSRETLHIVLLRTNTAADNQLIFPNVDGLLPEGPEEGEPRLVSAEVLTGSGDSTGD